MKKSKAKQPQPQANPCLPEMLTPEEIAALRQDAKESSAWLRAQSAREKAAKEQQASQPGDAK